MADTTSNLELHLTFDDLSGEDTSGHSRTATFSGNPKNRLVGQVGPALSLVANLHQFVNIADLHSVLGDNASLCVWLKRTNATPGFDVDAGFGNLGPSITGGGTHLPYSDGKYYFGIFRATGNAAVSRVDGITPAAGVDRTQWHHLAITTTPGANGYKVYINGTLLTQTTGLTGIYYDSDSWSLGKTFDPTFGTYYWDGVVDDLRIYSRTLSVADIAAVMAAADTVKLPAFGNIIAPSCHFGLMTYIPLATNNNEIGVGTENINLFNPPTSFSWENWADSVSRLNASAAFVTTKHCDGLTLWRSTATGALSHSIQNTTWGANGRDLIKEFVSTIRGRGMDVGFYFAVGDNWLKVQNSNGFGGNYSSTIQAQLTELCAYNPKFFVLDAWGSWWTSNNTGFPGYTDIAHDTLYNLIKGLCPRCWVIINNHDTTSGDVLLSEETITGNPAAGNVQATMDWRILCRFDVANLVTRWFTHSDTLTEPLETALSTARTVQAQQLSRGYIMAHNYSIGPNGRLTPDLQRIVENLAITNASRIAHRPYLTQRDEMAYVYNMKRECLI